MKRVSLLVAGVLATCLAVPALAGDGIDVRQRRGDLLGSHRPVTTQVSTPAAELALRRGPAGLSLGSDLRGTPGVSQSERSTDSALMPLSLVAVDVSEQVNSPDLDVLPPITFVGLDQAAPEVRAEIARTLERIGPLGYLDPIHVTEAP